MQEACQKLILLYFNELEKYCLTSLSKSGKFCRVLTKFARQYIPNPVETAAGDLVLPG
jgi:hypothetical protein